MPPRNRIPAVRRRDAWRTHPPGGLELADPEASGAAGHTPARCLAGHPFERRTHCPKRAGRLTGVAAAEELVDDRGQVVADDVRPRLHGKVFAGGDTSEDKPEGGPNGLGEPSVGIGSVPDHHSDWAQPGVDEG